MKREGERGRGWKKEKKIGGRGWWNMEKKED